MDAMAEGDLSRTVAVGGRDEIGTMAGAVDRATASVRQTSRSVEAGRRAGGELSGLSTELQQLVGRFKRV